MTHDLELKPCPFCGSANLNSGGDDKYVGYACLDCGALGPNHYDSRFDWNTRAALSHEGDARATDCEDETDRKLQTVVAPDNGTVPEVMAAILECARAWVPEARIIGNVRAGDIARAVESALSTPKAEVRGGTLNLHLGSNNTVDCGGADISDPLHGKKITIRDANTSPAPTITDEAVERAAASDQIIGQIEDRFPNWQSYRDLLDCIDCTMAELRRDVR
ncbi:hypothetical protein GN330_16685 [Nitratireductor sp. CAU 1489]|uniref:Restriction alleviation protein Lar n=1 Tax=Nitratireductor arenosus TaxID=2682096 RepID=A0A844QFZ4_9HYPH|nr:Lar family restriction alleviation protein [Nitratireductor arenosus]MVA98886.1 hypothetical protein [Nitratireductor arenosus]